MPRSRKDGIRQKRALVLNKSDLEEVVNEDKKKFSEW